jgi:hypothetical protein
MMEFLRALAPSHAAAKTRAVPVVRSRFESGRPLSHLPAVQVETLSQDSIADQRETTGHHGAITPLIASAREDETARVKPEDRHVVTRTDSRVTMSPVSEPLSVRSTSQAAPARAVPATRETAEAAERVRAVPGAIAPPASLRAAHQLSGPLQTAAWPVGLTMPEAAGSVPGRGPLSSGAVAVRSESRSDARPIIHVTIDRIDVRAPSVPERTSSRPRSRSHTSASLSDYLRARQTPRSGGTS